MIPKRVRQRMEEENKQRPERLQPVPRSEWPSARVENRIEVWLSRHFLAQVFDEGEGVLRVSVCRTLVGKDGQWKENLVWDELMEVKRQIGQGEAYAVEVLPPDRDIVNVANMRHFWILPERVVGWRKG